MTARSIREFLESETCIDIMAVAAILTAVIIAILMELART
jgi:hypothetical protein